MQTVIAIDPFEVKAEAAEDFLKTWHAAAGRVRRHAAFVEATLHRALNPNAPFQFVNRALWTSVEGFRDAITSTGQEEPPAGEGQGSPDLYRIVAEAAGPGRAGADHVVFIVFYEIEPGKEEAPFVAWQQLAETLKNQAGNISAHFHRALDPAARFQWVNYALWTDAEAFQAARQVIEPVRTCIPAQAYPALYRIVARITHTEAGKRSKTEEEMVMWTQMGWTLVDEHVYGHLFISLGENRYMGGQNASSLNLDFAMPDATLLADGRVIVADGKVAIEGA